MSPDGLSGICIQIEMQQAFTTPDTDNLYAPLIVTVNNSKRWMNQLPEEGLLKFGN